MEGAERPQHVRQGVAEHPGTPPHIIIISVDNGLTPSIDQPIEHRHHQVRPPLYYYYYYYYCGQWTDAIVPGRHPPARPVESAGRGRRVGPLPHRS